MPARIAVRALFTARALAIPAAGCAREGPAPGPAPETSPAPATPAVDEERMWADGVCGSFLHLVEVGKNPPATAVLNDPAAARSAWSGFVGEALGAMARMINDLDGIGPSPFGSQGDAVVGEIRESLVDGSDTLTDLRGSIDADSGTPLEGGSATATVKSVVGLLQVRDPQPHLNVLDPSGEALKGPHCASVREAGFRFDPGSVLSQLPPVPPPDLTTVPSPPR